MRANRMKECPKCNGENTYIDDTYPVMDTIPEIYTYVCRECNNIFCEN